MTEPVRRCICGASEFLTVFAYDAPPRGETAFAFLSGKPYRRDIIRCVYCGHFLSTHRVDSEALYAGDYVDSNYPESGIQRSFERIIALDPAHSDNAGRVERVDAFGREHLKSLHRPHRILDIGSGLGVFVYRMKERGWECVALDPDPRAIEHTRARVGVPAILGDFMAAADIGRFDAVALNRVLEHVSDPVAMLAKVRAHLEPGGFVYLELPDGERAQCDGKEREEFFIDHLHVFSPASLAVLCERSGFSLLHLRRLKEPSGKYTLFAFLTPAPQG